MNNNFEFLRKFFSSDSNEIIIQVFKSLRNEGLDVYISKEEKEFSLALSESDLDNVNELFLAAADCDYASKVVKNLGFEASILDYKTGYAVKTDADIAEEMFYKKRKQTYIEAVVIIIIGIIYYLLKK